jgi:hypothetical protein
MKVARIRLGIAMLLLLGWLGYLGFLVLFERDPIVVSRSQVMASTQFVLANVTVDPTDGLPTKSVSVVEDLRPMGKSLTNQAITIWNIKDARVAGSSDGFRGKGPFLLMLTKSGTDGFELTPPPRSTGGDTLVHPKPWAYRWDAPGVKEQFEELVPKR